MAREPIVIDGSQGEGGGQILRTTVGLAAALRIPVQVVHIRAGRAKPGLRAQHLAAIQAAASICNADVQGLQIGSGELTFLPGEVSSGQFRFDIGTAGSTVLVLQTVLPALLVAEGESDVTVTGGTHNPLAPCFEYLRDVFGLLASAANVQAYFELIRAGFYPAGGGEIRMQLRGLADRSNVAPLRLSSRGELKYVEGISAISPSLPTHVAERQARQTLARLAAAGFKASIEQASWDSLSPGTVVFVRAVFSRSVAGAYAIGRRGEPAEKVADEAVDALLEFVDSPGVVDSWAADQLVPVAALCPQESHFRTERVTNHLLTNVDVVRQLTERTITVAGERDEPGMVTIEEE